MVLFLLHKYESDALCSLSDCCKECILLGIEVCNKSVSV